MKKFLVTLGLATLANVGLLGLSTATFAGSISKTGIADHGVISESALVAAERLETAARNLSRVAKQYVELHDLARSAVILSLQAGETADAISNSDAAEVLRSFEEVQLDFLIVQREGRSLPPELRYNVTLRDALSAVRRAYYLLQAEITGDDGRSIER